jgi:hypothetical protein
MESTAGGLLNPGQKHFRQFTNTKQKRKFRDSGRAELPMKVAARPNARNLTPAYLLT